MSTTTICPHCGCEKHWSNSARWQDGFVCGTVVPFDGPTRRGEACQAIVQARTERDSLSARIQAGLDLIGEHGCDCDDEDRDPESPHECFPGRMEIALRGQIETTDGSVK